MAAVDQDVMQEAQSAGHWVGRGELVVLARVSAGDHHEAVRAWLKGIRQWGDRNGVDLAVRLYPEVGKSGNLHHHWLMRADHSVPQAVVRDLWREAVGGNRRVSVTCEAADSITKSSCYAVKSADKEGRPLLARGTKLAASYGHRTWYGIGGIEARWDKLKLEWFGPKVAAEPAPDPEPIPTRIIVRPPFVWQLPEQVARREQEKRETLDAWEHGHAPVREPDPEPPEPPPSPKHPGWERRRLEWDDWIGNAMAA